MLDRHADEKTPNKHLFFKQSHDDDDHVPSLFLLELRSISHPIHLNFTKPELLHGTFPSTVLNTYEPMV